MASVRVRAVALSAVVALSSVLVVASATPAGAAVTVTVTPNTALADGQPVTVTASGFAPGTSVGTAECSAAVGTSRNTADCDLSNAPVVSADQSGTAVFHLRAKRTINTQNGTVDCATAAQPCVIGAADISNISDPATSGGVQITFDPNAPPPPPPDVSVTPASGLLDRQQVAVYATGFLPGESVIVGECAATSVADDTCDPSYFGGAYATADPVGAVATGITVRRALRTPDGRLDCASSIGACVVMARAIGGPQGTAALGFDASVPLPPPPVISVTPNTGLGDRYIVSVDGSGFAPNAPVAVVECPSDVPVPFACDFITNRSPSVGSDGTFSTTIQVRTSLQQYSPKTGGPVTVDCTEAAGRCVVFAVDYNDPANAADAPLTFDPNAPPAPPMTITVNPSTALTDGQTVHITADGFPPGTYLFLVECVAGATDGSGCEVGRLGNPLADDNGHVETDFVVHQVLTLGYGPPTPAPTPTTAAGAASTAGQSPSAAAFFATDASGPSTFDCASAPGACTLSLAWLGNTIEAVSAPLTFDAAAAPSSSVPDTTPQDAVANEAGDSVAASSSGAQVQGRVVSRTPLARTGTDVRSPLRLDLVLLIAGSIALVLAAAVRARGHRRS